MSTASSVLSTAQSAASAAQAGDSTSFNAQQYVASIIASEQGPETLMQQQVSTLSDQATALGTVSTQLQALQTAVFALDDFTGALNASVVNSSDSSVATATATANTAAGSHTLVVTNLASTSSQVSNVLADGNTAFGDGSFDVQVGSGTPATVTVDSSDDTLTGLASAINTQAIGVTASVITDASGARLELVSDTSGAPGNITISNNTSGLALSQAVAGVNANFSVDGVNLSSTSNVASGVVPGVTLTLQGTSASPVTISVAPDTSQATTAIQNFVTAYNTAIQTLNSQFTFDASTGSLGPLGSDSVVAGIQQQLLSDAAYSVSGNSGITNLASIGISMNEDGTLSVDSSTLGNAMASNYSAVLNLFQQTTPSGFALNFNNDLENINDPGQGPIVLDQNGIAQSTTELNTEITDFQNNLDAQQAQLLQVYSQVAVTLQQMPNLLSSTESQLASLSGSA